MAKNIGKNISKSLSIKYSQKFLVNAKQFATDLLQLLQGEVTGDSIGRTIADRIKKISRPSQQNNLKTVINEHDQ